MEIFWIVVEDERVTSLEEFDEFALDAGISGGFAILEVIHLAFEERVVLEKIEDAEWGASDNNRRAKFYSLTKKGRAQLERELADWERLSSAVALILQRV